MLKLLSLFLLFLPLHLAAHCSFYPEQQKINASLRLSLAEESSAALRSGLELHFRRSLRCLDTSGALHSTWHNKTLFREDSAFILHYNKLSMTATLSSSDAHERNFDTIEAAMIDLGVFEHHGIVCPGEVQVRLNLEEAYLPTALRLSMLFHDEGWQLDTGWQTCAYEN